MSEVSPVQSTSVRSRILHFATALFAERGFGQTSLREVAKLSGCTKPAIYYHFPNKDELFLEAIREQTRRVEGLVAEQQLKSFPSVREEIEHNLDGFFQMVRSSQDGVRLLLLTENRQEHGQPVIDFQSIRSGHLVRLQQRLQQGQDSGEFRSDIHVEDAAMALMGCVDAWLHKWLHEGAELPDNLGKRIGDLFFLGIQR